MNNLDSGSFQSGLGKAIKDIIKSLGVVFGDIGTSPIYALSVIFFLITPTVFNVMGVLSLIIWTLILLVSIEYAWLAMSLGKKGEGGTIVLKELLTPLVASQGQATRVTLLAFLGISLFFGDGVVTPAVSILSAVEGILLIPGCHTIQQPLLLLVACLITIALFMLQSEGAEKVSIAFGPLMIIWFIALSSAGLYAIMKSPVVLYAINPVYAIKFLWCSGWKGFFTLSGVVLCATGGEALYADMGHLGRKPIIRAWYFVFIALVLNYLGQGAFLLQHPKAKFVLYEMILRHHAAIFIPFLLLSILSTIIASQAMISGIFSVTYQGIMTNMLPLFRIDYTSNKLRSQVYIPVINWILMVTVIFIILLFQKSRNLAVVYGFSVTGTMVVTGIMMTWIFWLRRCKIRSIIACSLTGLTLLFFLSNLCKIPHGGYWSIIIALVPFCTILIYTNGQRKAQLYMEQFSMAEFLVRFQDLYKNANKIKGTALFFVRDFKMIPAYVEQVMFKNNIFYEESILVSVITRDDPFGVIGFFKGDLVDGFRIFEIHVGYMEVLDIEKILSNAGIEAKVMFYGIEEIVTKKAVWKIFSFIKRLSPSFVQFYRLPAYKLHGVVTSVEM